MKEYIMPIDDTAFDWDEMFVGVIRKQEELIRCKDCESHRNRSGICDVWHHHTSGEGFCHRGRRYGQQTESKKESGRSEG